MAKQFKLTVGGIDYFLNTDEDEAYMRSLEDELNQRLHRLSKQNPYLSTTMVAVLAALEYCDESHKSYADAQNLRTQMKRYVEDAACAQLEVEEARREIERLGRENLNLRNRLSGR